MPELQPSEWALKILVLLHDPPWKSYIITKHVRVVEGSFCQRLEELLKELGVRSRPWDSIKDVLNIDIADIEKQQKPERHELEALGVVATLVELLRGLGVRYNCNALVKAANVINEVARKEFNRGRVEEADSVASNLDRLVAVSIQRKVKLGAISLRRLYYVNPFNPKLALEVRDVGDIRGIVCNYLCRLLEAIKTIFEFGLKNGACSRLDERTVLKLLYNLLYALLEPVWYSVAHGVALPAYTLFPTHTVFDHLYASALASNIVLRNTWCIAVIDVPGIQEFVSKGRKTRDYWAGSWLLSALTWKAVEEFIDAFGPDILVSPAPTFNMFYLAYLVTLVAETLGDQAAEHLDNMLSSYTLAWVDGWPSQPVIPATITVILPTGCQILSANGIVDLEKLVRDALNHAWCRVVEAVVSSNEFRKWLLGNPDVENLVGGHINEYFRKVAERAPFSVVVSCVDGADVSRRAKELVKKVVDAAGSQGLAEGLPQQDKLWKLISFHIAIQDGYGKLDDKRVLRCDPSARYSDVHARISREFYDKCGRFERCSVCGTMMAVLKARQPVGPWGTGYGSVIDERETLCPVCVVRRMVPFVLRRVVAGLGYRLKRVPQMLSGILSTHGLACFWRHVLKLVSKEVHAQEGFLKPLAARVFTGEYRLKDARKKLISRLAEKLGVNETLLDEKLEKLGETIIGLREPREMPTYCVTEYAVLRGDGDMIGKGYWRGALGMSTTEYVWSVYRHVIETLPPGQARSKVEQMAEIHARIVNLVLNVLKKEKVARDEATVLLTPSFVFTFSRSLMATAVLDSLVIPSLGGVLVFAGGDDVYAFLPLEAPSIVIERGKPPLINPAVAALLATYAGIYGLYGVANLGRYVDELLKALHLDKFQGYMLRSNNSPTLLAVLATRLNYWGVPDSWDGQRLNPGFHILPGITVAATVAYGRSYGINIAHYREPLWRVYEAAFRGEEEKDEIVFKRLLVKREQKKDAVIYMFRSSIMNAAALPLKMLDCTTRVELEERDPMYILPLFYAMIGPVYSKSLVYDALDPEPNNPWYKSLLGIGGLEELVRLYTYIIDRNLSRTTPLGLRKSEFMKWLRRLLEEYVDARVKWRDRTEPLMHHVFLALRTLMP